MVGLPGRPDLGVGSRSWVALRTTRSKRHPKYVHAPRGQLIHVVSGMEFLWYDVGVGGHSVVLLTSNPRTTVRTVCGASMWQCRSGSPMLCKLPSAKATMCKRCLGESVRTFDRGAWSEERHAARKALGCAT